MNSIYSHSKCAASFGRALLLVAALFLVRLALAEENQATIVAIEALLSLPQTQPPEGEWGHRAPPGFVFDENNEEAALISWLKKQKKNGADLNAIRHGGTMLHHVIRAGMVDTTSWLLANGADPLIEGEHDAFELALTYQQEEIFDLLVRHPGVLDAQRNGLYLAWKTVVANRSDWGLQKLVNARVPLPTGKKRQFLLDSALSAGNVRLIRVLTEAAPDRALRAKMQSADEDIEIADQRLAQPIFLSLIGLAESADEVDRLFRLRIRRPFDDPAFATQAVKNALGVPVSSPAAPRKFEHMPDAALLAAFKDEYVLSRWWEWLSHLPAKEDRAATMARWGDLPLRKPEDLLLSAIKNASWFDQNEKDPNAAAAWGEMLAQLRSPLPEGVQGKLWMYVPQAHRLTLLKLGYRPSSQELRWWIDRNNIELILAFWPEILAIRPEIGQTSHELLFDPVADDSGYYCISRWGVAEKALPLTTTATPPEKPYTMEAACWYQAPDTIRHTLLNLGWVKPPSPVKAGRIVLDQQQCAFRPSATWRRALAGMRALTTQDGESIPIDALMAVAVPGERDCVLLAWGGRAGGRVYIDEDSFEGTRRLTPCAGVNYTAAILRLRNGQIDLALQKDLPFPGGMALIRDTRDGRQYWLGGSENLGTCGQTPPQLFQFEAVNEQAATLRALPKTHPAMQALLSQCRGEEQKLLECLGDSPPAADIADARIYPEQGYGLGSFTDAHWNTERQAFVDAVLKFKPDVLSAMKAEGVFPHWVTDALSAVSASSLPLAEKRRRAAWLFRDRPLLRSALEPQMLKGLVDWLPREDWGPIIQEGPNFLGTLRYAAEQKGKASLACRFSTALKQPCQRKEDNSVREGDQ